MIKIRYADLPAGLHVRAESSGRSTILYLLPGLTLAQRRAALIRARRGASMGYGPGLPAAGVAVAVMLDRARATLRNGASAFRAHPLLLLPPVILVLSATFAYVMLAAVTITIRGPQASGGYPQPGAAPGIHRPGHAGQPGQVGGADGPGPAGRSRAGGPARSHRPSRSPRPSRSATAVPSPSPSSPASGPPGRVSPSPSASPSPDPSPSSSGTCLDIGPLGVCLKL